MPLRIAFFGTPSFAVPTLDALHHSHHPVALVVTQPDRPRGRGHRVTPAPVKAYSVDAGFVVEQPARLLDSEFLTRFAALEIDLGVVAAYGRMLPERLLEVPRLGMINVHASLLPRWRGAAPVHRAILAGDRTTGVTIMRVVKALDAGPVLTKTETTIDPDETSVELEQRLAAAGAPLLVRIVGELANGPIHEEAQDDHAVTYAHRLDRRDGVVDWDRPALDVHNQIRGLHPWPLAAVDLGGRRLALRRSRVTTESGAGGKPGTVLQARGDCFRVAALTGAIELLEVQLEGRPSMSAADFLRGHPVSPGDAFGASLI